MINKKEIKNKKEKKMKRLSYRKFKNLYDRGWERKEISETYDISNLYLNMYYMTMENEAKEVN